MQKFLVVVAIALFASALAAPAFEDSWDVEDELLQRVYEDSTPLSLIQKTSADVAHAKSVAAAGAAKVAAKAEDTYTKEEAAAGKKAASDAADMVTKVKAADKMSADADAAEKKN